MSVELLVNVTPSETRVALVENGLLQEVHVERQAKRGIVGNIYKGKISRVLPGMQAAFVDIGMDKAAFLHASDIVPHTECVAVKEKEQFQAGNIAELVRQGQDIMVQVVKDPLGTKGARLTTDITLPSAIWCSCRAVPTSASPSASSPRRSASASSAPWPAMWTSWVATSSAPLPKGWVSRSWSRMPLS